MAASLASRALLLAALPRAAVAARVQLEDESGWLFGGAFECPAECWECCAAPWAKGWGMVGGWGTSDKQFKCILRDIEKLPRDRECEEPEVRGNDPDSIKVYCNFNEEGEVSERPGDHCTTQGAISKWAEWLWQKKGEVFGLANANVMEMASIIRQIRSVGRQEDIVVPLSQLSSIHPIDEPGAIVKTARRARAAQAARGVLDKEPYTMTKALIASYPGLKEFQSVTGFYAVKLGEDEYVTFEGNGRCVALIWAFPEGDELGERLKIEVTEFVIDDEQEKQSIVERILALQKAMGSREFRAIRPPSLEEEEVAEFAKSVKEELDSLKAHADAANKSGAALVEARVAVNTTMNSRH